MMRSTTEAAFLDRDYNASSDKARLDAARHRHFGKQQIEAAFEAIYRALLAIENDMEAKQRSSP
jgi:hypothetical protein